MVRARIEPLPPEGISRAHPSPPGRPCGGLAGASNLLGVAAHSPAVLELIEAAHRASDRMVLPHRLRLGIALRVAELHGCRYCLALHTDAMRRAGLDGALVRRYRMGVCEEPKEQALLALAGKTLLDRGRYTGLATETARELGASEEEIVEVLALVGLHTLVNYVNLVAGTSLDFPDVDDLGLPPPPSATEATP